MPSIQTALSKQFSLKVPLIVAPLGGGPTTAELVGAACEAGVLGSVAGAYLSPENLQKEIAKVRSITQKPFAINLFTPMPHLDLSLNLVESAIDSTRLYRNELQLPDPILKPPYHPNFDFQFEKVLQARPAVFSYVFGLLPTEVMKVCRREKIFTMGTATTLDEALALEESGADAVVVQGYEAGGHRGMFSSNEVDSGTSTFDLVQITATKLKIPVVAAGGIMNGKDMVKMLRAGAQAVQLGTAFLLCDEAGTSRAYREALLKKEKRTRMTRVFSGRWARGIENRFMLEMEQDKKAILPFPAQNALTRDLRNRSSQLGNPDFLSLWAGMNVDKIRQGSARKIIHEICQEADLALQENS